MTARVLETDFDGVRASNAGSDQPYLAFVEAPASEHLLIYAGSYDGKFAGMTTGEKLGCNCLFIRSDEATWYLQSYDGLCGPKELAEFVNAFVATKPHIKTITLGGFSMGAYGVLVLAVWLKCNRVVATAPQTKFPIFEIVNAVPTYPASYGEEWWSVATIWQRYGRPTATVTLQACASANSAEHFNDIAECNHLISAFPDVAMVWYDCCGHIGFQSITTSVQLQQYEDSFL